MEHPATRYLFSLKGFLSFYQSYIVFFAVSWAIAALALYSAVPKGEAVGFIVGLVFLFVGLVLALIPIWGYFSRIKFVEITKEGLRWQNGRGEQHAAWEELDAVFRLERMWNVDARRETALRLVTKNGNQVVFNHSLAGYDELAGLVQKHHAEVILPVKRSELGRGTTSFGPVTLESDGVMVEGARYALNDITVSQGNLVFKRAAFGDGSRNVPLSEIPDYLAMLELLEELRR